MNVSLGKRKNKGVGSLYFSLMPRLLVSVINKIFEVRQALEATLATARPCPDGFVTELSPCGRYRLEIEEYVGAQGQEVSIGIVRRADNGLQIATIKQDDSRFCHGWASRAGHDYLLCSERLIGGQSVIDLMTGEVAGFSSSDEEFIWTQFHASPSGNKLAVIGCYWACPYQAMIYDFREPLRLPLPKLAELRPPNSSVESATWIDDTAIQLQAHHGAAVIFEVP